MLKHVFWLITICLTFTNFISAQNARFAGMGNASVSTYDLWGALGNQAGLSDLKTLELAAGYENKYQFAETGTQAMVCAVPTRTGNFALSVNRFGYNLYSENNIGLAFARNLGKFISAGIQFDYFNIQQPEAYGNRSVLLFEAGLIAKPIENLFIGAHIFNPTRAKLADYKDERVPTIMRFGLGYYFSKQVLFNIETEKNVYYKARFKAGIEYEPINQLYFRTGFANNPNQYTFGLGYIIWNLDTNIAIVTHEWLPLSTEISLAYKFKNN